MRILKSTFLIITLIFAFSCSEDYLDRPSLDQIGEENFWTNERDALVALNGMYSNLQSSSMYGGSLNGWQGFPGFDNIGDNAFNQFKWEGPGIFMEGSMTTDSGPVLANWTDNYQGIYLANEFIEQVTLTELIEEDAKPELLGQAYFIRALHYFNLSVFFEEAPLITEVQELEDAYVPKDSYEEIYAQIVEDLTYASENLPTTYPSNLFGYVTKGAALGLFARVQLYNGMYQGENGVLELTNELLGLGYSLHPNYSELFTLEGENSNEIVFSVKFFREVGTNNGETFSGTFQGTPKVDQRPMPNLVNDYYCIDGLPITESPLFDPSDEGNNRDPRAKATIYFPGDVFIIILDEEREFTGNSPTGYGMRKYIRREETDSEGVRSFSPGSQDFYLIRYADVLLMRAEALAETGDVGGAMELVNQVRARVNMPSVENAEGMVGQQEMIEIVRHERRVELALEGLRFMDLKRWDQVEEATMRALMDPVGPYNPQYLGERSEVFPIPQSELDVNPELEQHPAW